jgi:hypothetical protein
LVAFAANQVLVSLSALGLALVAVWIFCALFYEDRSMLDILAEAFFLRAGFSPLETVLMGGAMASVMTITVLIGEWWLIPILILLPGTDSEGRLRNHVER